MNVSSTAFAGSPYSVAEARAFVTACLRSNPYTFVPDEVVERAELITSELATNALRHTRSGDPGGSYEVHVAVEHSEIRVEIHTREPRLPHTVPHVVSRANDPTRITGRGLYLVDLLATRWDSLAPPPKASTSSSTGKTPSTTLSPDAIEAPNAGDYRQGRTTPAGGESARACRPGTRRGPRPSAKSSYHPTFARSYPREHPGDTVPQRSGWPGNP